MDLFHDELQGPRSEIKAGYRSHNRKEATKANSNDQPITMKLSIIVSASLFTLARGARYGLLRVGSSVGTESHANDLVPNPTRSLLDEDSSL